MSNTRTRRGSALQPNPKPKEPAARSKFPIAWVVGAVVAVAAIVAIIASFGPAELEDEYGTPTIAGESLPPYQGPGTADAALGLAMPTVTGVDFDGNPVIISPDGRPKAIIFLAHWCGHCQNEVPVVQEWIDDGEAPDGVDILSVSTFADRTRPNFPPSAWLDDEGWTPPVLLDDEASSVMTVFGGTGTPFWVFVDSTGTVVQRTSGETAITALDAFMDALAAS